MGEQLPRECQTMIGNGHVVARGVVLNGPQRGWRVEITVEEGPDWVFWYLSPARDGAYDTLYTEFADVPPAIGASNPAVEWEWLDSGFAERVAHEAWQLLAGVEGIGVAESDSVAAPAIAAADDSEDWGSIVVSGGLELQIRSARGRFWAANQWGSRLPTGERRAADSPPSIRPLATAVRETAVLGRSVVRFVDVERVAVALASATSGEGPVPGKPVRSDPPR